MAWDQATVNSAYSVWVDSKLITYDKITADKSIKDYRRSFSMVDLIMNKVNEYKPNLLILEGAFAGTNIKTYGMLSCLRGMTMERFRQEGYAFEIIEPVTWKSAVGITGKRPEQKRKSIEIAERIFDVTLFNDDDIADSINIGGYAVSQHEGINYYEEQRR